MVEDYRELLIGCGRDSRKRYSAIPHHPRGWQSSRLGYIGPVTLDNNALVSPDIWCDLNQVPPWHFFPRELLSADPDCTRIREGFREGAPYSQGFYAQGDYWDEIHAYQVLEHLGRQGDAHAFFKHFEELWRLLKPNGYLVAEVPSRYSGHLWGDPGHARAIVAESLTFLDQGEYQRQIDGPERTRTTMSDYRGIYHGDFKIVQQADNREHFVFVLQAIKPSRWSTP